MTLTIEVCKKFKCLCIIFILNFLIDKEIAKTRYPPCKQWGILHELRESKILSALKFKKLMKIFKVFFLEKATARL
jgi:hypothetical protein